MQHPRPSPTFIVCSANGAVVSAFTNQGNTINIACTIYFRLKPEKLYELYNNYKQNYMGTFSKQLTAAIKNKAAMYKNEDYYVKREEIKKALFIVCQDTLLPLFAEGVYLMLREMEFPENIDQSLIEKVTKKEGVNTQTYLQQRDLLLSAIKVITAEGQQNITQILAKSVAYANSHYKTAVANQSSAVITAESTAYATLMPSSALGLDSVQINYYRWIKAYGRWASSVVFFGQNTKSALVSIPDVSSIKVEAGGKFSCTRSFSSLAHTRRFLHIIPSLLKIGSTASMNTMDAASATPADVPAAVEEQDNSTKKDDDSDAASNLHPASALALISVTAVAMALQTLM